MYKYVHAILIIILLIDNFTFSNILYNLNAHKTN